MCGITGFLGLPERLDQAQAEGTALAMARAIARRGPDSDGAWADPATGIAFGHRRLAILDLSPAGHQPMAAPSGRYVICYNGEIYNHLDLRAELEGAGKAPAWRGHSDTETLLAGFDAWGIEATITRAVGMFAIAVWDRETRVLSLIRDRMGEKPLYFGWQGEGDTRTLLFGSELAALRVHPSFEGGIDRRAIVQLMRHSYVGEDLTIHEGLSRVQPGEIVEISWADPTPRERLYWSGAEIAATTPRQQMTPEAATDAFEALLMDAVERQMMSDVPLGAFLSGGVDSSAIVGLMAAISTQPVHTYSIGFHEKRYNEAEFAKSIADHLGTDHTELYVGDTELRDVVPQLPSLWDEPFADSSQIPTYLVAKLAREHVTVALSGDGGDELFCGYDRYRQGASMMRRLGSLPRPLRAAVAGAVQAIPARAWGTVMEPIRPTPQGKETNGQRLHRLADYLAAPDTDALHRLLVSRWRRPEDPVLAATEAPSLLAEHLPARGGLGDAERMMQLDMLAYLPDDILTKVDRAAMAVSLESRAPLLDHRVVEFAWSMPYDLKVRDGQSKWLLRQVLYRHVPRELIERPKQGFEVPIGLWLRGALKDWAAALLEPGRLRNEGYFDPNMVNRVWQEHLSGRWNHGLALWNVLMFQAWLEAQDQTQAAAPAREMALSP
jgi:asparagine synthase (glutamine-hydrolysing)